MKVMNTLSNVVVAAILGVMATFLVLGPMWYVGCVCIGQSYGTVHGSSQAIWLVAAMVADMYVVAGSCLVRLIRR